MATPMCLLIEPISWRTLNIMEKYAWMIEFAVLDFVTRAEFNIWLLYLNAQLLALSETLRGQGIQVSPPIIPPLENPALSQTHVRAWTPFRVIANTPPPIPSV